MAGENRQEPYLAKNPAGQMPALELDDGVVLAEILPICEYLEEIAPDPPLIGTNAEERAMTRMWTRRIDLNICEPMANGFRFAEGLRAVPEPHPLHPAGRRRPEGDRRGEARLARRPDRRPPVDRRRPLHAGRHPALRLPRVRRPGRPAARSGQQEPRRLDGPRRGPAQRGGERLAAASARRSGSASALPAMREGGAERVALPRRQSRSLEPRAALRSETVRTPVALTSGGRCLSHAER